MDKRMNMYPSICKILKRTYTTNGNNNNVRQQIFNTLEKQKGNVFTREFIVDETKSTTFVKPIDIYSTPAMIWDMEWFTRDIILDAINDVVVATDYEENLDSVGTNVVFKHTAATPIGETVFIETKIIHIDEAKSKIETETIISDSLGILGKGKHERAIVDMNMINQRIQDRKDKLK